MTVSNEDTVEFSSNWFNGIWESLELPQPLQVMAPVNLEAVKIACFYSITTAKKRQKDPQKVIQALSGEVKGWFDLGKYFFKKGLWGQQWLLFLRRHEKCAITLESWLDDVEKHKQVLHKSFPLRVSPWSNEGVNGASTIALLKELFGNVLVQEGATSQRKNRVNALRLLYCSKGDKSAVAKAFEDGDLAKKAAPYKDLHAQVANFEVVKGLYSQLEGLVTYKELRRYVKTNRIKDLQSCNIAKIKADLYGDKLGLTADQLGKLSTLEIADALVLVSNQQDNYRGSYSKNTLAAVFFGSEPKIVNNIKVANIERDNMRVRILNPGEKRALYIGELTGCCQHYYGVASKCAIQTYTQADFAVLVVENTKTSKVYAQSFLWRATGLLTDKKFVVMDSIESIHRDDPSLMDQISGAIYEWARKSVEADPELHILVAYNDCGITDEVNKRLWEQYSPQKTGKHFEIARVDCSDPPLRVIHLPYQDYNVHEERNLVISLKKD